MPHLRLSCPVHIFVCVCVCVCVTRLFVISTSCFLSSLTPFMPIPTQKVNRPGPCMPTCAQDRCGYVQEHCLADGEGILNFTYFHYCTMEGYFDFSVACLTALVLLSFYLLGETAEEYFCPVVNRLTEVSKGNLGNTRICRDLASGIE